MLNRIGRISRISICFQAFENDEIVETSGVIKIPPYKPVRHKKEVINYISLKCPGSKKGEHGIYLVQFLSSPLVRAVLGRVE